MSKNSSEYNYDLLMAQKSMERLQRILPANIGMFTTGTLAATTNILILLIIWKHKPLHSPSHCLIGQLAVADWLVGVAYMVSAAKRIIRLYHRVPEVNTRFHCAGEMSIPYFSQAASLTLALAISVERIIGTARPIFYQKNVKKIVATLSVLGWTYAVIDTAFMFYGITFDYELISNCILVSSVTNRFYTFQSWHKLAQVCVMMGIYALIMFSIRHQVALARTRRRASIVAMKKQIQVKIARMLGVISLFYLVTQILTRVGMAVLGSLPPVSRGNWGPFIRILMIVNSGINFFVYVSLSPDYRNGFRVLRGQKVLEKSRPSSQPRKEDEEQLLSAVRRKARLKLSLQTQEEELSPCPSHKMSLKNDFVF